MNKITVYGLPLNPQSALEQLAGASFCVSYATRQKLGKQLDDAIRLVGRDGILLIDNGAFSMHKQGVSTRAESYQDAFEDWAQGILDRCPQAIAVIPDVIGGTEEENADLAGQWQLDPERSMAIWHLHESFEYLTYLCESYGYVGFGSSGDYWQVGTAKWHARIRDAFAAIDKWEADGEGAFIRPRIHMMRAQSEAHRYPFDSSDSTNVAMNHGRYRAEGEGHVKRFAARVDAKIQASAGAAAEHQIKRPLLDHVEAANDRLVILLEVANYSISSDAVFHEATLHHVTEIEQVFDDRCRLRFVQGADREPFLGRERNALVGAFEANALAPVLIDEERDLDVGIVAVAEQDFSHPIAIVIASNMMVKASV